MPTTTQTLLQKYEESKQSNPKLRIRDHAKLLGVSEAELLATGIGKNVSLLEGDFKELLKEIHTMGRVMALTRNDDCVHERKGVYNNVSFDNHVGLVLDPEIDLRLFMNNWKYGFSVDENGRLSFQFFDKSGEAVHKIYLTENSDLKSWSHLKSLYEAKNQQQPIITEAYMPPPEEKPDEEIDVNSFQTAWKNMTDTHQFFGILNDHGLTRKQALRLSPKGFVNEVPNDTVIKILEQCSLQQVPIMIFVSSRGCIQIHSGEINKLVQTGPWFNILDQELNLHLRSDAIHSSYIVRKPSEDGIITSLELFDNQGKMIVQFFGKRKPGIPEIEGWRGLVKSYLEGINTGVIVESGN